MYRSLKAAIALSSAVLIALQPVAATLTHPIETAPANHQSFEQFFAAFRAAVLNNDRQKVADMVILPFRDFSGAEMDRSARTHAEFLVRYDAIFTPAVVAAIRSNRVRAFKPGSDDGEAPGPIAKGEYLLDVEDWSAQIVFARRGNSYGMARIPFYS
jgi:hypothetical protein